MHVKISPLYNPVCRLVFTFLFGSKVHAILFIIFLIQIIIIILFLILIIIFNLFLEVSDHPVHAELASFLLANTIRRLLLVFAGCSLLSTCTIQIFLILGDVVNHTSLLLLLLLLNLIHFFFHLFLQFFFLVSFLFVILLHAGTAALVPANLIKLF